jgi:integrase
MLFDLSAATGIKCTAHRFRHTFCTWCADAGLPMLHLQQLVGHKTSDMVARYYPEKTSHAAVDAAARVRFSRIAGVMGDA